MIRYLEDSIRDFLLILPTDEKEKILYMDGSKIYCRRNSVYIPNDLAKWEGKMTVTGSKLTIASIPLIFHDTEEPNSMMSIHGCACFSDDKYLCLYDCNKHLYRNINIYMDGSSLRTIYGRYNADAIGKMVSIVDCPLHEKSCFEGIQIILINTNELVLLDGFLMILLYYLSQNQIDDTMAIMMDCIFVLVF